VWPIFLLFVVPTAKTLPRVFRKLLETYLIAKHTPRNRYVENNVSFITCVFVCQQEIKFAEFHVSNADNLGEL